MIEITMPKLSDTMTEGRIVAWNKGIGDTVARGEILAEVETDKANMELEAFASGTLLEIRVKVNEIVPVGTVIAVIGAGGEAVTSQPEPALLEPVAPEPAGSIPAAVVPEPPPDPLPQEHQQERAAPVVRRRARELGINLDLVQGSAPGGRILLEDLASYVTSGTREQGSAPEPAPPLRAVTPQTPPAGEPPRQGAGQPLSRMRMAIARTVIDSWHNIPHFYVTMEINVDEAEEVRRELKESDTAVSLNDMVIKAAALALRKFPLVNATFAGERVLVHEQVNIGYAVSLPEGLLIPVIRNCDTQPLRLITQASHLLARKAREGKITEEDISGGTFTISNLGMYGVKEFGAVILPHQAAILAVGAVSESLRFMANCPLATRVILVTLSADHRVLDGVYVAQFLGELKMLLENPVRLLL
jgi:pyruvate dehydrogenase E2 component (dihydrolipoamide acetyltransferase)